MKKIIQKLKMFRLHNLLDNFLKCLFSPLLSFVLTTRMLKVKYLSDPDHLLTPVNGEGRKEKAIAENFFPTNFSDFDIPRSTKFGLYGYVIVTSPSGHSILQPQIWAEVKQLQDIIVNMKITHGDQQYQYKDICAKWNGECYTKSVLSFADTFAVLSKGVFRDSVATYFTGSTCQHVSVGSHSLTNLWTRWTYVR